MEFTVWTLLIYLVIAAIAGGIGRAIAGGTHGGCLVSIAVGFIGGILGSWIARKAGLPDDPYCRRSAIPLRLVGRRRLPLRGDRRPHLRPTLRDSRFQIPYSKGEFKRGFLESGIWNLESDR